MLISCSRGDLGDNDKILPGHFEIWRGSQVLRGEDGHRSLRVGYGVPPFLSSEKISLASLYLYIYKNVCRYRQLKL